MTRERAVRRLFPAPFRRAAAALVAASVIMGAGAPAMASVIKGGGCYSRSQHAAEQLIRMHTEMMVVGLTCQSVMPERAPFAKYQDFTVKNRPLISKAEGEIMTFLGNGNKGAGTRKFDMYRTEMANEISRRAAVIGTPLYCSTFVDRSQVALSLSPDEVRTLTADEKNAGLMHLSEAPLCDIKVVSHPDTNYAVASADTNRPARAGKPAKPAKPAAGKPATEKVNAPVKAAKPTKPAKQTAALSD